MEMLNKGHLGNIKLCQSDSDVFNRNKGMLDDIYHNWESRLGKPSFWTNNPMPDKYRQDIKERGLACSKKIISIKDGVETEYSSQIEAERQTSCDRKTMRMVAKGIYKQSKGYVFKFI